jgi:hypothetical protein
MAQDNPHDLWERAKLQERRATQGRREEKARIRQEKRQGFPLGETDLSEEKERHERCHLTR